MKLVNSLLEKGLEDGLVKGKITPNTFDGDKRILKVLKENVPNFKCGYVVSWTPEQGEDLYSIVVNEKVIFKIEVNRIDLEEEVIWSAVPIKEYRKGLKGKPAQLGLEIALKLLLEDAVVTALPNEKMN